MTDNLSIEPDLFYGNNDDKSDNPSEPEIVEAEKTPEDGQVDEDPKKPESEGSEKVDGDEGDGESLYVDFEGEEVGFDEISLWKKSHTDAKSMQADYTRKTMAISEKIKDGINAAVNEKFSNIETLTSQLEAIIATEDNVDMKELREDDPEEYIKRKELQDKRQKLIEEAKSTLKKSSVVSEDEIQAERVKLSQMNPEWIDDDGKATEAYKSDMKALDNYLVSNEWTQDEFSNVYHSKHMTALIKAAKYDALKGKAKNISEKRKKAPVVKKGKDRKKTPEPKSFEETFWG